MKMHLKKLLCLSIISALALVSFTGCTARDAENGNAAATPPATNSPDADTAVPDDSLVLDLSDLSVGACVMSLRHEFMANLVVGYKEFIKQTNCNLIITDGGNMEPEKPMSLS